MPSIPLMHTGVQTNDLWQSRVKSLVDPVLNNQLTQGILLSNITLNSGSTTISHKLGRQPQGWFLVDINGNTTVWRTAWNTTTITLSSSAGGALTASLWVF